MIPPIIPAPHVASPVCIIPVGLPEVTTVAKHLEVGEVELSGGALRPGNNMIHVESRSIMFRRAAKFAFSVIGFQGLKSDREPFPRCVKLRSDFLRRIRSLNPKFPAFASASSLCCLPLRLFRCGGSKVSKLFPDCPTHCVLTLHAFRKT